MSKKDIAPILKELFGVFPVENLVKMRDYLSNELDNDGIRQITRDIDTEILKRRVV